MKSGSQKLHLMGISYGGFIGLDFARLYQERLHTLTLSGILLSHEKLFELYQEISLRFYRSSDEVFEIYTQYMYEKIFGEAFAAAIPPESFEAMRQRFYDRYIDHRHCLIRLTEAQDPFFGALEENMAGYNAIETPTVLIAGSQDRAIPLWQQKKILDIVPNSRWLEIPGAGHVVYLESPELFFGSLRALLRGEEPGLRAARGGGGVKPTVRRQDLSTARSDRTGASRTETESNRRSSKACANRDSIVHAWRPQRLRGSFDSGPVT